MGDFGFSHGKNESSARNTVSKMKMRKGEKNHGHNRLEIAIGIDARINNDDVGWVTPS